MPRRSTTIDRVLESRRASTAHAPGQAVTVLASRLALTAVIALLIVGAYYPFAWDPPRTVHNQVTRISSGALRFGTMNQARTQDPPAWLPVARRSGTVEIAVTAESAAPGQRSSMMMLASDFWHMDFAIQQEGSDLYLWLRRPGSDVEGDPPFVVPGVVRPHHWLSVDVLLAGDRLRIEVGGRTRLTARIPADTPGAWSPAEIALGDAVHGGNPWQGEISRAEVRTGGYAVDYVRPGALSIPASYFYSPDHIEPFPPPDLSQWLRAVVDLLTFIPVGFLIVWSRRPPIHPVPATLLSAVLAVALAAGKFLFHQRHTSVADVVGQVIGALLGALVAWWLRKKTGA
jgi:hypothetical protein